MVYIIETGLLAPCRQPSIESKLFVCPPESMNVSWSLPLLLLGFSNVPIAVMSPAAIAQVQTAQLQAKAERETAPPTSGLFATTAEGEQRAFPLQNTDVQAKISGNLSRVAVTQTFENPFEEPLEAIYVFPLPDEAAVDEMEIKIGDRVIKGDIKKREEARAIYNQARAEGRTAGLLEQERANIFTQSLANIKPGETIEVTIRYSDSLKFEGGDYEFVFPMVVGPRFIPGNPLNPDASEPDSTRENWGQNTDRVPDASRITPPVLPPGMRSGHDINVTVGIESGGLVQDVRSPSHQIITQDQGENITVQLDPEDAIPNKDLILRYQVSGKETQATVLTQADDNGGHFALYLVPALDYDVNEIVPKDVVFLMDTSGSQRGEPIAQSKRLMERFIDGLNPRDTFTVIDFANAAQALSPNPLANTQKNRELALDYVAGLEGNGGTQLLNGIDTVLNFPIARHGRLRSVVLLTDGLIGDDNAVIARVQDNLPYGNRLYGFGVGSSVNRFLLDRLAEVGRGTVQVVRHDEPVEGVVETFFEQINNPVLANVRVTWQGEGDYPDIYPHYAPDLFANQPLVLFGRKGDAQDGTLRVSGVTANGRRYTETFEVNFDAEGNPAIAQLWGRARIKELMTEMVSGETRSGVAAVTETALAYNLLSEYTAFVAVSQEVRVDPDGMSRTVDVPVELPDGTSYEGFFGSEEETERVITETLVPFAPTTKNPGQPLSSPAPIPNTPTDFNPPERGRPSFNVGNRSMPTDGSASDSGSIQRPPLFVSTITTNGLTLNANATQALLQHFSSDSSLLDEIGGGMTFEVQVRNGQVTQIVFDDAASDFTERTVVQKLRDRLQTWQLPETTNENYQVQFYVR